MLSLIVAIAKNRVIGFENKMPWHLPAELAYFKRVTMGHPIIMGRKTFESIGRPLPGRRNIVVSRDRAYAAAEVEIVHSLAAATAACKNENAFIIGGATLYAEALPKVDRLYITEIDASPEGDTFFPALDGREWKETSRERRERDEKNQFDVSFIVLDRIVQNARTSH
jgi:dihydrofolate reductase